MDNACKFILLNMKRRERIGYISGKYTEDSYKKIQRHIKEHRTISIKLWKAGFTILSPILNTSYMEKENSINYEDILTGDIQLIRRLDPKKDFLFMLPNWLSSKGARREREEALKCGIKVFYNIRDLETWADN